MVRGTVVLPNGLGKFKKVLVIASGEKQREATEAGADFVGGEDMVAKIQTEGWTDFDAVVATFTDPAGPEPLDQYSATITWGDGRPLAGFDQDDYVQAAGFDNFPLADLIGEFKHQRRANILAIQRLSEETTRRHGTASGCEVSGRALIYMLVGHVEHHMASLGEKYLPEAATL